MLGGSSRAEQSAAADALQRPLRSRFRQRLSASVRWASKKRGIVVSSIFSTDLLWDSLLNAGVAIAVAILANLVHTLVYARARRREPSFTDRVSKLAENLNRSSREVDSILKEIASVMADRQAAAAKLEEELSRHSQHESELKQRIDALKDVPIPVAEHFAKLTESGERRSARRDYLLFGAGVLTSIVTAIALRWVGLA
jgi:hypothetical protein